jgi:hypothetical protein
VSALWLQGVAAVSPTTEVLGLWLGFIFADRLGTVDREKDGRPTIAKNQPTEETKSTVQFRSTTMIERN